jgi:outer membrane lipoprotein LolB
VVARDGDLTLTNARGQRLDGAAARADLERQLGFELPLASLRYWVLGVPDPAVGVDEERLSPDAPRLEALGQAGWQVAYRAYAGDAAGLPRRIDAVRGLARLRLLVEQWAGEDGR